MYISSLIIILGGLFQNVFHILFVKPKKNTDLKYYYFLREFEEKYGYYFIDNNGLIQLKQ